MGEEVWRKGRGKSSRRPLGTSVVSLSLVLLCWGLCGCRRVVEERVLAGQRDARDGMG